MRPTVFLSCGQNKESDEVQIAQEIARAIEALGFNCYMAVSQQSLRSLRENIFYKLDHSDYFIFVDFKRDSFAVRDPETSVCRGSLFSNQELAIASFLDLPTAVFQETGVRERDGMLSALQANAIPFSDRRHIPAIISEHVRQLLGAREWRLDSVNRLTFDIPNPVDAPQTNGSLLRHYHVTVRNEHATKPAISCYSFLASYTKPNGDHIDLEPVESKWAGSLLPSICIPPKSQRRFDVCQVSHSHPGIRFKILTDSQEFIPQITSRGSYQMSWRVISENFPEATVDIILETDFTANGTGVRQP